MYLMMLRCVCGEMNIYIWLCKDTGAMNRPLRLAECFATNFVGERNIINNPLAALRQTTSSRRGPIYRAHIYEYTHEMEDGNACVVERKHVFGEMDMYIWLCKDTGAMNRPLRLAECSQPISWVNATLLTNR